MTKKLDLLGDEVPGWLALTARQLATVRACREMVPSFRLEVQEWDTWAGVYGQPIYVPHHVWLFEHAGKQYGGASTVASGLLDTLLLDAQRCIEVVVLGRPEC